MHCFSLLRGRHSGTPVALCYLRIKIVSCRKLTCLLSSLINILQASQLNLSSDGQRSHLKVIQQREVIILNFEAWQLLSQMCFCFVL